MDLICVGYWGDWIEDFNKDQTLEDLLIRVNIIGYTQLSMSFLRKLEVGS